MAILILHNVFLQQLEAFSKIPFSDLMVTRKSRTNILLKQQRQGKELVVWPA